MDPVFCQAGDNEGGSRKFPGVHFELQGLHMTEATLKAAASFASKRLLHSVPNRRWQPNRAAPPVSVQDKAEKQAATALFKPACHS